MIEVGSASTKARWLRAAVLVVTIAVAAVGSALSRSVSQAAAASQVHGALYVNKSAFSGHGDLAFVSLGDLYVLDGVDGHVTNATGPGRQASDPEFSPNGRWLTYETGARGTSWLTQADGGPSKRLPGVASWLPNGQLAVRSRTSTSTFTVTANEALRFAGHSAAASAVRAGHSMLYLFVTSTLKAHGRGPSRGVERIETATTPNGRRTLWYQGSVSFTPLGGLEGTFVGNVSVLPDGRGLLLTISNYCCDYADGQELYELRSPLGEPQLLGPVLDSFAVPTYGPGGTFAYEGGGDRYAWVSKHVEQCVEITATCTDVPTPKNVLSLSPTWSPDHKTLAFVEAGAEPEGPIGQPQVIKWYATHHLDLLSAGSRQPAELAGTQGAAAPLWSANSQSLIYVDHDALYLLTRVGAHPVKVAGPLFATDNWTGYFGNIAWTKQFAWSQAQPSS